VGQVSQPADPNVRQASQPTKPEISRRLGIFFSIYFAMTGLHAIHVIAGMGVIGWILRRAIRGDFGRQYYGPVDYVGLYWHLVDVIWIFLFPLLYLID
jgi:cytochrome c oxidase subunit 3